MVSKAVSQLWMTYSQDGGSSRSQILQSLRETNEEVSEVGCCMYCAFQNRGSMLAFLDWSWSSGHCSGQSDFSRSSPSCRMAGSSTISQRSASGLRVWKSSKRPVRSSRLQRVMTTMIAPPGIRRCKGPVWNQFHAVSNARRELILTSCSECGSSITKRSAPRPASAPPTPTA